MLPVRRMTGRGAIFRCALLVPLIALQVSGCGGREDSTPSDGGSARPSDAPALDAAVGADVTIINDASNSCGAMGEPCCTGDTCSEGLGCTGLDALPPQHRCYPCGHSGERCCLASPYCAEGQRCGAPLLVSGDEPRCSPAPEAGSCIMSCSQPGGQYCGRIADNCGKLLECDQCADPRFTCGGAGIHNLCGAARDGGKCTGIVCETSNGQYCGVVGDGCGSDIDCGPCGDGTVCGASGLPNMCGTTPDGGVPRDPPPPRAPKPPPPPNLR